jgi:diguanylate cyclase
MYSSQRIGKLLFKPTPPEVRDALNGLRYLRLQRHIPVFYAALLIIVAAASLAASGDFPIELQLAMPIILGSIILVRFTVWMRRRSRPIDMAEAGKRLKTVLWATILIATITSIWTLVAWFETADSHKAYVPMYQVLGALSATICLASHRKAAFACLSITLVPICAVMLASADHMHLALGLCVLACAMLQGRLISQQHDQIVDGLRLEQSMRELAETDMLTGLPNRRAFFEVLDRHLVTSGPETRMAVALLDLDGFKPVNDRLGHMTGDALLQIVAERLRLHCGRDAMVARLGGDEFAIFYEDASDLRQLGAHTTGILASLAQACTISGRRVAISGSLGIAHYPRDGQNQSDLLRAADAALYQAKASGRSQIRGIALVA